MLANAWFSHAYFKLSFGRQDKIAQQLDALALVVEDPIIQFKDPDKTLLRQAIATQDLKATITHLRRYVPFRLIIPFLETDLGQVSRGKGNQLDVANHHDLLNLERLRNAYEKTLPPLITLAANQGFLTDWHYAA
jgi:hypothetical protein